MWEQLSTQVNEALVNVATGLMALGAAAATYYLKRGADKLKAETGRIQDQAKAQLIWHAIDRLDDTAEKVVAKTEQTLAGQLRQDVKDGKVDRAELAALGQKACREIIQTLEPEIIQVLKESLGDLEAYVMSTVEAEVLKIKEAGKDHSPALL